MIDPALADLLSALMTVREEYDCASVAAGFVGRSGGMTTVAVYRTFATIADDSGQVNAISLPEAAQ